MAKEVKILVTAKTDDVERLMNRIEILKEVTLAEEHEEADTDSKVISGWPEFDMLVKLKSGAPTRAEIEELLTGVNGVEVRLLK